MRAFATLYRELEESPSLRRKQEALGSWLAQAQPLDAAWGVWLLSGGRLRGPARSGELRRWLADVARLPDWLVEESYSHVGDLAETLALLHPPCVDNAPGRPLSVWIEQILLPLAGAEEDLRREAIQSAWRELSDDQRLVFNKLLTGALRVGVSSGVVQRALAAYLNLPLAQIAERLIGDWRPDAAFLDRLREPDPSGARGRPYPFFLATPLEPREPAELGAIADWLIEWKWDGIRLQLIRRDGCSALWSRGEERLDGRFPEIEAAAAALPDGCVLDGELLAWNGAAPLPFGRLQTRIQRRRPSARMCRETPLRLLAYDLLEAGGEDLRELPLEDRRARLQALLEATGQPTLQLSPELEAGDWSDAAAWRGQARARAVEGLMLKRRSSPYRSGRRRGDWWKWKLDPLTIDAVLIYAQAGHGRRANLHTDYTFALWQGEQLLPIAKAYSGLDDAEILRLDRWIRAHTRERFGPVRSVAPELVFELAFEAVQASPRHKSGIALRFPRIRRWREDKTADQADRLETLAALAGLAQAPDQAR